MIENEELKKIGKQLDTINKELKNIGKQLDIINKELKNIGKQLDTISAFLIFVLISLFVIAVRI